MFLLYHLLTGFIVNISNHLVENRKFENGVVFMFTSSSISRAGECSILETMHLVRDFLRSSPDSIDGDPAKVFAELVKKIQGNTALLAEACKKELPLENLMDVILVLALRVAVNEYRNKSRIECSNEVCLPFHVMIDSFREAVSNYRGNIHVTILAANINEIMGRLYDSDIYKVSAAYSTNAERVVASKVSVNANLVCKRLESEYFPSEERKRCLALLENVSNSDLEVLLSRTNDPVKCELIQSVLNERAGTTERRKDGVAHKPFAVPERGFAFSR